MIGIRVRSVRNLTTKHLYELARTPNRSDPVHRRELANSRREYTGGRQWAEGYTDLLVSKVTCTSALYWTRFPIRNITLWFSCERLSMRGTLQHIDESPSNQVAWASAGTEFSHQYPVCSCLGWTDEQPRSGTEPRFGTQLGLITNSHSSFHQQS